MEPKDHNAPARSPGGPRLRARLAASLPALAAALLYAALTVAIFRPVLACLGSCYVEVRAIGAGRLMALHDSRLNSWILAWVQHALLTRPLDLFHANAFHPAPDALAGSEHLIGLALLALPLRLVTDDAVTLHQVVVLLSGWILALSSFALVRWVTGSRWIAALAGALALLMPWRTVAVGHVQILGAHWFPLVWLFALRILLDEERPGDRVKLGAVLTLQLLTSFYLAYQLTLCLVLLVAVALLLRPRASPRAALRLAWAAAVPYALLVASAIPYLARASGGELDASPGGIRPVGLEAVAAAAWRIAPTLVAPGGAGGPRYPVPAGVALLAAIALGFVLARRARPVAARRMRVAVVGLWACAAGAFAFSIGSRMAWGGWTFDLPGGLASRLVPGFANLRSPERWAVTLGIAAPLLAACGLRLVETAVPRTAVRRAVQGGLALLLLASLPGWPRVTTLPAHPHPERVEAAVEAVRTLPPGPLLEIPWPLDPMLSIAYDTRYMLASTRHWRPLLNGFTAYPPRSTRLLRRVAQGLPAPDALRTLSRLTDLRWIVVHVAHLGREERLRWERAARRGVPERVYSGEPVWIFEMPHGPDTGTWMGGLVAPGEETLAGLPRGALALPPDAGKLELLSLPPLGTRSAQPVFELRITNASGVGWPGLDPDPRGLVELRATFAEPDGATRKVLFAPLDADLPAGTATRVRAPIPPPRLEGSLQLRLDLVQRIGSEVRPLPVPAVELDVEIAGRRTREAS